MLRVSPRHGSHASASITSVRRRSSGIDYERARQGYQKLDQFIQAALKGQRPSDGYFVEFWRLLVQWPEIIAWDRLFDLAKHQVLAEVNAAVKSRAARTPGRFSH